MKLEGFNVNTNQIQNVQRGVDPFALDVEVANIAFAPSAHATAPITSKSLCTTACDTSGSCRSFCC